MGLDKRGRFEKVIAIWALLLGSIALLFVVVSLGDAVFASSGNIASWVQAIGSVVAIAVGFYVANNQMRESNRHIAEASKLQSERELQVQNKNRRAQYLVLAYLHIDVHAWADVTASSLKTDDGSWRTIYVNCVELISRVDSLTIADYPNLNLAPIVSSLRLKMRSISLMLELGDTDEGRPAMQPRLVLRLTELKVASEHLLDLAFREADLHSTEAEKNEDTRLMNDYRSTVFSHFRKTNPSDTDQSQSPLPPAACRAPTAG